MISLPYLYISNIPKKKKQTMEVEDFHLFFVFKLCAVAIVAGRDNIINF